MEYLQIFITSVFVNNIILSQFLGICPFLGVSKKLSTAAGMGTAVIFVMTVSTLVTFLLYHTLLVPFALEYMKTLVFILIIAAMVQMVEIVLKKTAPALYQALGIFLPLITTNCAVLGIALLVIQKDLSLGKALCFTVSTAVGFLLALVIFASLRERIALTKLPKYLEGAPVALVTAALLSMSFIGFTGMGN